MTPAEILTNAQAEIEMDETMTIEACREGGQFIVTMSSVEEKRIAVGKGRRLKAAYAKALNTWNGDEENGSAR